MDLKKIFQRIQHFFFDRAHFKLSNNNFIFSTVFCPYLIEVNKELLKVNQLYPIESKINPIGLPPIYFTINTYKDMYVKNNINIQKSSYVINLFKRESDKRFFVIVYLSANEKNKHVNKKRDFSIIEYDNQFQKINEYLFNNGMYNGGSALMTKNGLIVSKNKIKHDEKQTFSLISFTD